MDSKIHHNYGKRKVNFWKKLIKSDTFRRSLQQKTNSPFKNKKGNSNIIEKLLVSYDSTTVKNL